MKYIFFLLFPICLYAQDSFLSVSHLKGDDESTQSNISIGTGLFDNGQLSIFYIKNTFLSDEEELDLKGGGLGYNHDFHKYLSLGFGLNAIEEGQYTNGKTRSLSLGSNINHLWNSLNRTYIEFEYQESEFNYKRTAFDRDIDRTLIQKAQTTSITQEVFLWLDLQISITNFTYNKEPAEILESGSKIFNFLPEIQSMLYGFPLNTRSLSMIFYYESFEFIVNRSTSLNAATNVDETSGYLEVIYTFSNYDISLLRSRVQLDDETFNQTQIGFSYYF